MHLPSPVYAMFTLWLVTCSPQVKSPPPDSVRDTIKLAPPPAPKDTTHKDTAVHQGRPPKHKGATGP